MNTTSRIDRRLPVDRSQRPRAYFWPLGLETQLLTHVKGAARRMRLKAMIDAGQLDDIPEYLRRAKLTEDERLAIGRLHPALMGGEYLPDQDENEVEIARIEIASTLHDVTCVYARRDGRKIHYRVVDEYGGDTLTGKTERTSRQPLTLGELADFFLGAWPLILEYRSMYGGTLQELLDFFEGSSEFYPDFDRLLREMVLEIDEDEDDDECEELDEATADTD